MICIYHKGCLDGFAAAWVVRESIGESANDEYIAAKYGDDPPDVTNRNVIIVDFSYPRNVMIEMHQKAKSMIVIDHHKTAQEACAGLDFCIFDTSKSGAVLTWRHFYPNVYLPEFLEYVQDHDLWIKELPHTKEITAAMYSSPFEFETFDLLNWESATTFWKLVRQGEAILRARQKNIDSLTAGWAIDRIDIAGHNVPVLNCPHWLASDVLNVLAQDEPFAMSYSDSDNKRTFQLRSSEAGVDVSEVAKKFGGGGHYHAAGFVIDKPDIFGITNLGKVATTKNRIRKVIYWAYWTLYKG